MGITEIRLTNFTAFRQAAIRFSPGINALVGANSTGKTHLLKLAYTACDFSKKDIGFGEKLVRVFLPSFRAPGRLVNRATGGQFSSVEVYRGEKTLRASFSASAVDASDVKVVGGHEWKSEPVNAVYIPVKEMLAHAPGFRSLYTQREVHFEEIYADIIDRALLPFRRGPMEPAQQHVLDTLERVVGGSILQRNEEFFVQGENWDVEFTLLAEGLRKLGLLWLLVRNGSLERGSVLFWDEPETNLNPALYADLITVLLELSRLGVQIFLATHDYLILKELDLQARSDDEVLFHSLYRHTESSDLQCATSSTYSSLSPNPIADAFAAAYDREIKRSLRG